MRPALGVALVIVALAPSAHLAWTARDVPHLGYFHDDSIYWVCARSIAKGAGYRIASLPGQPYQTKYPPAYPLLLAGVWKLDSEFPANLRLALALNWLLLPAFVLLARWSFTDLGVRPAHAWMLSAALALNPYNALCGISLLSDLLFSCLLIAALALIERSRRPETRTWMAAAAGLAAAAAFLTRPVGVLLLAVGPALFLLRKQYRRAALFAGAMLPGVLAWAWWVHSHRAAGGDLALLYYTDYLGYLNSGPLADLPMIVWTNFDSLIRSLGGMLLFDLGDSFWAKSLARVVAI